MAPYFKRLPFLGFGMSAAALCLLILIQILHISPAFGGNPHAGGLGPVNGAAIWGCVGIADSPDCLSGAIVTIQRGDDVVVACSYVNEPNEAICEDGRFISHNEETYPYYAANISYLLRDLLNEDGVLTTTAVLTISAVYTDGDTTYQAEGVYELDPADFDVWNEVRVDIQFPDGGSELQRRGGEVQCADWPDRQGVLCDGALSLPTIPVTGTHFVAPDGLCGGQLPCYDQIQAAVDAANAGDFILVATGTYTSVQTYDGYQQIIYDTKGVTILGGYTISNWVEADPQTNPTVLDAENNGRVVHIRGPILSTIAGFTLQNGNALGQGGDPLSGCQDAGGNIYALTATVTIHNNQILDGTACDGGGVYLLNAPFSVLTNNTISGSTGFNLAGGLYIRTSNNVHIEGNLITGNLANEVGGGTKHCGGFRIYQSDHLYMGYNTISNNRAANNGGAGCIEISDNLLFEQNFVIDNERGPGFFGRGSGLMLNACQDFNLIRNTITGNKTRDLAIGAPATTFGGGVFVGNGTVYLEDNLIRDNDAVRGGGVYIESGTVIAFNGDIIANNAVYDESGAGFPPIGYGGGIYNNGAQLTMTNTAVVSNATATAGTGSGIYHVNGQLHGTYLTIGHNQGASGEGIIITGTASALHLTNTIIASQTVGVANMSNITPTINAILWSENTTNTIGAVSISAETVGLARFDSDGIHLLSNSAAIDQAVPTTVSEDIDGQNRPNGAAADLGADEFYTAAQTKRKTPALTQKSLPHAVVPQAPQELEGTAYSIPISPQPVNGDTIVWSELVLVATILPNTQIQATLVDETNTPVPGFENLAVVDGENRFNLNSIDGELYPTLRIKVDLSSTDDALTPSISDWSLSWVSSPILLYRIYGEVTDGHFHWLSDMVVQLRQEGETVAETTTDEEGLYLFDGVPLQNGVSYTVRLLMRHESGSNTQFQLRYARESTFNGDVVVVDSDELTVNPTIFPTEMVPFNLGQLPGSYTSNVVNMSELDDIGAIYHHTDQVLSFIDNELENAQLRPLDVNVYAQTTSSAMFVEENASIVIGEPYAAYQNGNRPMNREWHEAFHFLMAESIGFPPEPNCEPSNNHGGWRNCSTADSWVEGWAEFWSVVLAEHQGWPNPGQYQIGLPAAAPANISLEYNHKAWDQACDLPQCPYREEFAVASLLWDLHDPIDEADGDGVAIGYSILWDTLTITNSESISDVKALYDLLVLAGVGATSTIPNSCNLNDLDLIFVNHGFFYDIDDNRQYDCGEEIGRGANRDRPGRRSVDAVFAVTEIGFTTEFTSDVDIKVEVNFEDNPQWDYTYYTTLPDVENQQPQLLYLEPPPTRDMVIITLSALADNGAVSKESFVISNQDYWPSTESSDMLTMMTTPLVVQTHTYDMHWLISLPTVTLSD